MIDPRRAGLSGALLVSFALTVVACGGATATPTPTPTPVGEATPTPAATPTPETPPGAEATPVVGLPSFDLSGLTNNLDNVDSYRIAISMAGSTVYQATVVNKPEKAEEITLGDDDGDTSRPRT